MTTLDGATVLEHLGRLPTETHAPGEIIVASGATSGKLYVLREGKVEVTRDEVTLGTIDEPGAVIGEIAALLGQPHSADVRVTEPSTFYVAHADTLIRGDPVVALHVASVLARRLHGVNEQLVDLKRQVDDGAPRGAMDESLEKMAKAILVGGAFF